MSPGQPTLHKGPATPERSFHQRMDALARANEIRSQRAQLKRDLKAGAALDPSAPPGPPGVPRDRQGLRHAARCPQVRPSEGEQDSPRTAASRRARRSAGSRSASGPNWSRCCIAELTAALATASTVPPPITAPPPARCAELFVITGPSGVGKGTLITALRERHPSSSLTISATTRAPRQGEEDGVDYYFLSETEFDRARARRVRRARELRGAPLRDAARRARAAHPQRAPAVLEIEVQGARQIREAIPGATLVFIAPPSLDVARRAAARARQDDDAGVARRLQIAETELAARDEFPIVIVNDDLAGRSTNWRRLPAVGWLT